MKSNVKTNLLVATRLLLVVAALVGSTLNAKADVPREKREPLANVLNSSFRERDSDQVSYKANDAAIRPEDRSAEKQARNELKSIRIEIGDGLAGKGTLVRSAQAL